MNLDVIGLLKQRISSLEEQHLTLQCDNVTHKRTIEDLHTGSQRLLANLTVELQRFRDTEESQTSTKKRRVAKGKRVVIPIAEIKRSFGGLPDINGKHPLFQCSDVTELPTVLLSIQVLLHPDTDAELLVQAAHGLATSLLAYLHGLISTSKPFQKTILQSNPPKGIQYAFGLLTTISTSSKLSLEQRGMMRDIILRLIEQTLHLIHESCVKVLSAKTPFTDLREHCARGIATVSHVAESHGPLRQAVLLELLSELKRVRCTPAEGEVELLAKDDMMLYLYNLIAESVETLGEGGGIWRKKIEGLVWEILSDEVVSTVKGNWIVWCVAGLLLGY